MESLWCDSHKCVPGKRGGGGGDGSRRERAEEELRVDELEKKEEEEDGGVRKAETYSKPKGKERKVKAPGIVGLFSHPSLPTRTPSQGVNLFVVTLTTEGSTLL
ncbi:unnamed protein product [Pleuronectes platessa]|uniref:Uncharacterized protein n=1 Tax=Pleuronectes platessa TaxID=8262 RepID=A0A9N7Y9X7_PLEPL|nr:unnamed protein product [Pleuronectes platessa]